MILKIVKRDGYGGFEPVRTFDLAAALIKADQLGMFGRPPELIRARGSSPVAGHRKTVEVKAHARVGPGGKVEMVAPHQREVTVVDPKDVAPKRAFTVDPAPELAKLKKDGINFVPDGNGYKFGEYAIKQVKAEQANEPAQFELSEHGKAIGPPRPIRQILENSEIVITTKRRNEQEDSRARREANIKRHDPEVHGAPITLKVPADIGEELRKRRAMIDRRDEPDVAEAASAIHDGDHLHVRTDRTKEVAHGLRQLADMAEEQGNRGKSQAFGALADKVETQGRVAEEDRKARATVSAHVMNAKHHEAEADRHVEALRRLARSGRPDAPALMLKHHEARDAHVIARNAHAMLVGRESSPGAIENAKHRSAKAAEASRATDEQALAKGVAGAALLDVGPIPTWSFGAYSFTFRKGQGGLGVLSITSSKLPLPYHMVVGSEIAARREAMIAVNAFESGRVPAEGVYRRELIKIVDPHEGTNV